MLDGTARSFLPNFWGCPQAAQDGYHLELPEGSGPWPNCGTCMNMFDGGGTKVVHARHEAL